eukprot:jgi/Botrbrau1/18898/Bobra.177_2s0056.1
MLGHELGWLPELIDLVNGTSERTVCSTRPAAILQPYESYISAIRNSAPGAKLNHMERSRAFPLDKPPDRSSANRESAVGDSNAYTHDCHTGQARYPGRIASRLWEDPEVPGNAGNRYLSLLEPLGGNAGPQPVPIPLESLLNTLSRPSGRGPIQCQKISDPVNRSEQHNADTLQDVPTNHNLKDALKAEVKCSSRPGTASKELQGIPILVFGPDDSCLLEKPVRIFHKHLSDGTEAPSTTLQKSSVRENNSTGSLGIQHPRSASCPPGKENRSVSASGQRNGGFPSGCESQPPKPATAIRLIPVEDEEGIENVTGSPKRAGEDSTVVKTASGAWEQGCNPSSYKRVA